MSQDWEQQLFFPHGPLTAALLDVLFTRLAAAGLFLDLPATEYPALALAGPDGRTRLEPPALEDLLRSRQPPVGPGYGVLPLRVHSEGAAPGVPAFLTFGRPHRASGLDSVTLAVDGAAAHGDHERGPAPALDWLTALAQPLAAVYGWADWETATFLVAAPMRRDILSGTIRRLFRWNLFGPALLAGVDTAAPDANRRPYPAVGVRGAGVPGNTGAAFALAVAETGPYSYSRRALTPWHPLPMLGEGNPFTRQRKPVGGAGG